MKGVNDLRVHAFLFLAALGAAVLTWNRDVSYGGDDEEALRIWDRDTTEVLAFGYRVGDVEIQVERRNDQAGDYLWGTETVQGDGPGAVEFPVGSPGHNLLDLLAGLRTMRDLGPLSTETMTSFGIAGSTDRLSVRFTDERRELVLGDRLFGSEQRYAYEPATGVGHVLLRDVVTTLSNGSEAIRERRMHHFPEDVAAGVRVRVGADVRTLARIGDTGEWAEAGSRAPDVAFGTFMQRVGTLAIEGFAVRPGPGSRALVRVDYLDGNGETLGFMELLRDDSREADPYFIVTETTRVPAQAVPFLARRVEEGLAGAVSGAGGGPSGLSES